MNIIIIGLGLIGGSIGRKLKAQSSKLKVAGIPRRQETIKLARKMGAIDEGSMNLSKIAEADIVFICTPINLIIPKLKAIIPYLKKGVIVTDVGSTKAEIVSQAEKLMPPGTFFVGGHPLAGKEKFKLEAAEADLFKGKTWVLTKTKKTSVAAINVLKKLISKTGAKVLILDPAVHDLAAAGISHLPLALAAALANTVANSKKAKSEMLALASTGFSSTTRVASGDPELGGDMFITNREAVLKMIGDFKLSLSKLEKAIRSKEKKKIIAFMLAAKLFRDKNVKI